MPADRKIAGHKSFWRDGTHWHEPLYEDEAKALLAACDAADKKRAEDMPNEKAAVQAMMEAWVRLKELGWREAEYCPKDGTPFLAIEPGSTGFHERHYDGDWPDGHWWVCDDSDMWPSRLILFKPLPEFSHAD